MLECVLSNQKESKTKQTVDSWTVWIFRLLQARHGQSGLNPHIGELVSDTDQHGLVDVIKEVVVYLGVLRHTAQQLVDQLAHTETHRVATDFVRLGRKGGGRKCNSPNSLGEEVEEEERDEGLKRNRKSGQREVLHTTGKCMSEKQVESNRKREETDGTGQKSD